MKPKITAREGWIEVEIDNNCDYPKFEEAASMLKKNFGVKFNEKFDHHDDAYWNFTYNECELTLHFNHYLGISLFPKKFGDSTNIDNDCAKEIGILLYKSLHHCD